MRITTRNLLGELLVDALEQPSSAAALYCLVEYCRASPDTPTIIAVDRFLLSAPEAERDAAFTKLQTTPLLAWDSRGRLGHITLAPSFSSEWQEIAEKLIRFGAALEEWGTPAESDPLTLALRKGALLFNHQLFFEVHEILEAQLMKESGEEKLFLQGLIQVAVAFYHLENRNLRGALSLLQDGIVKIAPYRPTFLGIELQGFLQQLQTSQLEMLGLGEAEPEHFSTVTIPTLPVVGRKLVAGQNTSEGADGE